MVATSPLPLSAACPVVSVLALGFFKVPVANTSSNMRLDDGVAGVGFCVFAGATTFSTTFSTTFAGAAFATVLATGTAFSPVFAFALAAFVGAVFTAFVGIVFAAAGAAFAAVVLTATFLTPSFFPAAAAAFVLAFRRPLALIPSPSISATTFFGRPRFLTGSVVAAASMAGNWACKIP